MDSISKLSPFLSYYIRNLYRKTHEINNISIQSNQLDFIKLEAGIDQLKNCQNFTKLKNLQVLIYYHQNLVKNNAEEKQIKDAESRIFEVILKEAEKTSKHDIDISSNVSTNYYIGNLLKLINSLISESSKYLGITISIKYMQMTKLENTLMNKIYFNELNVAFCKDFDSVPLTLEQAILFRKWIENYIKCCSTILPNFEYLLKDSMQLIKILELSIEQSKRQSPE